MKALKLYGLIEGFGEVDVNFFDTLSSFITAREFDMVVDGDKQNFEVYSKSTMLGRINPFEKGVKVFLKNGDTKFYLYKKFKTDADLIDRMLIDLRNQHELYK